MTLRKQTFSGVRWTTFSSIGRAVLQFLQISILARLLAPADFGLIALVVAVMAFLQIFADAGISNAIIHFQEIEHKELSSLYWLNVGVSSFLAFMLAVSSGWISTWYRQPELQYLLMLAAVTLVITSIGQQLRVVSQKNLRFADLAKLELVSALAGFCIAVALALVGAGVYALMAGTLSAALVGCVLAWLWLSDGWRPLLRLRLGEIRDFVTFGAYMIGNNLVNTFNLQIDILLGGRLLGAQGIGLYSVPKDLCLRIAGTINPIVTQVGLPVMSKAQDDEALLRRIYLQTLRMTGSVNFPIYVLLGTFAPELVPLILGEKWLATVPLMQIFAAWALLRSTGNPVGSLLMARGRADLSFKWNLAWLVVFPPAIWAGSQFGAAGMAIVMTGLGIVGYWPNWYFLVRPLCGAGLGEYTKQLAVPLILSAIAGAVALLGASMFEGNLLRLIAGTASGALIYLVASWKFNRAWVNAVMELAGKVVS
jgi:O-antigen/teichoic acid export membrane protein